MYSIAAMLDEFDKGFSLSKLAPRIKITRQYRMRDAYMYEKLKMSLIPFFQVCLILKEQTEIYANSNSR